MSLRSCRADPRAWGVSRRRRYSLERRAVPAVSPRKGSASTRTTPDEGLAPKGEGNGEKVSTTMKTMKKPLIGTLLATAVASAILAAPVGAAKPTDSITCTAGGLTTLTWISGTTSAVVTWLDGDGSLAGQAVVHRHHPWSRLAGRGRHTGKGSHCKRDVLRQKASGAPACHVHTHVTPPTKHVGIAVPHCSRK